MDDKIKAVFWTTDLKWSQDLSPSENYTVHWWLGMKLFLSGSEQEMTCRNIELILAEQWLHMNIYKVVLIPSKMLSLVISCFFRSYTFSAKQGLWTLLSLIVTSKDAFQGSLLILILKNLSLFWEENFEYLWKTSPFDCLEEFGQNCIYIFFYL